MNDFEQGTRSDGDALGYTNQDGSGGQTSRTHTLSTHQQLVPEMEEFMELSMRSYYSFEEIKQIWARDIRNRRTGILFYGLPMIPRFTTCK